MALFKIFRETTLPGTLQNDALYVIAPAATPNYIEIYATNSSGVVRRVPTDADITAKINASLASIAELSIVADIAARNALAPTAAKYVYVQNATADATVLSGGATYLFNPTGGVWIKVSEAESMDVVVSWASITGKPTSTPAQIDAAVTATHAHANLTQLNQIGDTGGQLSYNGALVKTEWSSLGW